jgi:hypothetical protein
MRDAGVALVVPDDELAGLSRSMCSHDLICTAR